FGLSPNTQPPPRNVDVSNQFGSAQMVTGDIRTLCLPTWKNEQAPEFPNDPQPAGLDHFVCYDVKYRADTRFRPPPTVELKDQFGGTATKVGPPRQLCVPTRKQLDPAIAPPALLHPRAHLLCFGIAPPT